METVNYTDFRSNLKYWFDKVVNDVSDIIIKRKSGKDLVLISLDEYNSLKETTYLLTGINRDILLNMNTIYTKYVSVFVHLKCYVRNI